MFQPTSSNERQCSDIQISADDILENTESFLVILNTSDRAVLLSPSTATVQINDTDRKYIFKPKLLLH